MNIDNLTYGELKQIAAMFSAEKPAKTEHPFVGKYCIVRCHSAGVHAGEVVSADGCNVILRDSRRLWSWKAKSGIALSGLAQSALATGQKVDTLNPIIALMDAIELIPATTVCRESINAA